MYAIIRAGGKQAKVEQGDVLDVERVKGDGAIVYTPLLVVQDDGTVISDRQVLSTVTVTAEVLGASAGPKIDSFKYKSKTGYRRRVGHRQKYSRIQVTGIEIPGGDDSSTGAEADAAVETEAKKKPAKATAADDAVETPASAGDDDADSGAKTVAEKAVSGDDDPVDEES
jgi:large subunit ribosomal protein L21